ncbi:MAG: hypothetical protein HQL37_01730 [Alphaproteobacteria bacterium]|nr:hypothetical protein [Alphaproteobacteria bacterium]
MTIQDEYGQSGDNQDEPDTVVITVPESGGSGFAGLIDAAPWLQRTRSGDAPASHLDGDRRRMTAHLSSTDVHLNPWDKPENTEPPPSEVTALSTVVEPGETEIDGGVHLSPLDKLEIVEPPPSKATAMNADVELGAAEIDGGPVQGERAVDVPVEDLFNGVINALGDGLEFSIKSVGRTVRLLGRMRYRVASDITAGVDIVEKSLTQLSGRKVRKAYNDDETGLE